MAKNYDFKKHWDNAYESNSITELGWYEDNPKPSIELIEKCKLSKDSMIFHAGAGSSLLIGLLLEKGYANICVNDISFSAINNLRALIGSSDGLTFVVDDLTNPKELCDIEQVDLWHDRAVLHFFVQDYQQEAYFNLLKSKVRGGGYAIFSEFAIDGAKKCCGLDILNYSDKMLKDRLGDEFKLLESFNHLYSHPSNGNTRKYIYSLFRRRS